MFLLVFSAVHTVARGHQLVYEGWKSFEEMCSKVGVGELAMILRYLEMATTPTPTPSPTKMEAKEAEEMEAGAGVKSTPGTSGEFIEKPIDISVGAKQTCISVGTATLPPNDPEWVWIPTSMLSTQRRP